MFVSAYGTRVEIDSNDRAFGQLLEARYGALRARPAAGRPALRYRYRAAARGSGCVLAPAGREFPVSGRSEALHRIDSELVVALQRRRSDLLFVHAAALERAGRVCLLAATSGTGKSTTSWGLLHHGFSYASDELSAVALDDLRVLPYPRALCLKQLPPAPYRVPASAVRAGTMLFIPSQALPSRVVAGVRPLAAVFVLERSAQAADPAVRAIGAAEAAARLYATTLNALAHPDRGLGSVLRLAGGVPCFRVSLGALERSCALLREVFDSLVRSDANESAPGSSAVGQLRG